MSDLLPIIILAGSDERRASIPRGMQASDMIAGYKGMLPLPNGKVMAAELVETN